MSDDRQQTSDEWDAMVKRKAREYQAPDSTPPAMTDHAQLAREFVPRILRDDGMIEAQEVAHYTHLNLTKYVLATDYAQAHAAGRRDGLEASISAVEQEEELPGDMP